MNKIWCAYCQVHEVYAPQLYQRRSVRFWVELSMVDRVIPALSKSFKNLSIMEFFKILKNKDNQYIELRQIYHLGSSIVSNLPVSSLSLCHDLLSFFFFFNQQEVDPRFYIILYINTSVKVKVKSLSRVRLLATPWTTAHQALRPWDFPGKSTGVGCHCLLR